MPESSYNAPRLHVAMQARKIVISGEVAGLQIQLGTPAFPGRFDSCDLPPKSYDFSPKTKQNISVIYLSHILLKNAKFIKIKYWG